ncbi:hypothetical protein AHAS_Ahas02G0030700 [Arachis hypogaea]
MGEPRWKTKTQTSGLPTFFFFFLLWRRVVSNTNKENQIAGDEAAYLKQLRKAVSPAPSSWFNVTNMRDWGHVTCTDSGFGLTVEEINLISMPLTGTLLPELKLNFNNFTSIPRGCFQGLSSLQLFNLDFNTYLEPWTFPASLTDSSKLTTLSLHTTNLMGSLPDAFDSFPKLEIIDLSYNNLNGVFPKSFTKLLNLRWLFLIQQKLTGKIEFLSSMTHLEIVWLQGNSFQGLIPDLSNCTKLQDIFLADNVAAAFDYPLLLARSWRGNNPCNRWRFISCDIQGKITTVNLTNLNLTGTISSSFAKLSDLRDLHLGGNNLSESIPESLTTLSRLKILDVSNNNLSGIIPTFSPNVVLNTANNAFLVGHSPTNQPSPTASRTKPHWIKLGAAAIGSVVGVVAIFGVIVFNRKRRLSLVQKIILSRKRKHVDRYVESLIKREGGYSIVYKANLADGEEVAVKILKQSKGSVEEFIDWVFIISRTSHVNIVSLLEFCYDKNKRALVYEFMHNDSLNKFTYRKEPSDTNCNMDWNTLYQISIGIVRGLEYLHHGCNTRILHLHIKLQNILLDECFPPKIADFGLAKICKKDQSIVSIIGTGGTPGYIAPKVFSRTYGGVSHKSDVYSYGMLILEIIGGRQNYYENVQSHASEICFPDWIYKDLEQGNIPANCLLHKEEENGIAMKMTLVSLWCIQPNPLNRPSISKVIEMLEGLLESIPYPPKPALFSPERFIPQYSDTSYSNRYETCSITTEEIVSDKSTVVVLMFILNNHHQSRKLFTPENNAYANSTKHTQRTAPSIQFYLKVKNEIEPKLMLVQRESGENRMKLKPTRKVSSQQEALRF